MPISSDNLGDTAKTLPGVEWGEDLRRELLLSMPQHCVLQVEDDDNDIYFLKFAWERGKIQHSLRVATSGEEAQAYLRGEGKYANRLEYPLPSLVLLDLKMPRMNGFDVLKWIRSRSELDGTVVIILSSSAIPEDIAQACALGANGYVQKPPDMTGLQAFLTTLSAFWFEFNQYPRQLAGQNQCAP